MADNIESLRASIAALKQDWKQATPAEKREILMAVNLLQRIVKKKEAKL